MSGSGIFRFVDVTDDAAGALVCDPTGRCQAFFGDMSLTVCDDRGRALDRSVVDVAVGMVRDPDGSVTVRATLKNIGDRPVRLGEARFETSGGGRFELRGEIGAWSRYKMGFNTGAPSGAAPLTVPDSEFFMKFVPYSFLPASVRNMVFFDRTRFARKIGRFESEWFTALYNGQARRGVAFGFAGVTHHFSRVMVDLEKHLVQMIAFLDGAEIGPGQSRDLDPLVVVFEDDFNDVLRKYARAVAAQNQARVNPARIWCSWYSGFYDRVTVRDIRENMRRLALLKSPVEYIQLDDGYQSVIGDWLETNSRFPEGLEALACEILHSGFKPGIWTAPFSVSPDSTLFAEHPDWIVRTRRGSPIKAGFIMGKFGPRPYYALDTTIPEVRDHVTALYRRLRQMGWVLFKVDFLTSAMVEGVRRDPARTRAEAYRLGMQAVRDGVGDDGLMLSGIGPFLPNCGVIDIQRLSPDTCFGSPSWVTLEQKLTGDRMTPGVRNQTSVSIARTFTNDILWSGDPDAIVGPGLPVNEQIYLKTVALMTGSTLTIGHDFVKAPFDFDGYTPLLDARGPARAPDLGESGHPRHLTLDATFEGGTAIFYALLNPTDVTEAILAKGEVFGNIPVNAVDYWSGQAIKLAPGQKFELGPRSSKLFVIRRDSEGNPVT